MIFKLSGSKVQQSVKLTSAELTATKLLSLLKEISESENAMYGKSIERLKRIQSLCVEINDVLSFILEEESIKGGKEENIEIQSAIHSMLGRLNRVEMLVNGNSDVLSSDNSDSLNTHTHTHEPTHTQEESDSVPNDGAKKPTSKKKKDEDSCTEDVVNIPTKHRKEIVQNYKIALSGEDCTWITLEAKQCGNLIAKWFDMRILNNKSRTRYNIHRIRKWVLDMVILSGYHIENGDFEEFCSNFHEWLNDDTSSCYVVPHDVYECDTNQSVFLNITALVLYDMLYDATYNQFEQIEDTYEVYLKEDSLYNICKEYDSECLDLYCYYGDNKKIIKKLKLTTMFEGASAEDGEK